MDLEHGAQNGHESAFVRTVDSDVLVIAISTFDELQQMGLGKLWVGLGTGKNYRNIPIHEIYVQLGPNISLALPIFHALTGCYTTSQMLHCGKKQRGLFGRPCHN